MAVVVRLADNLSVVVRVVADNLSVFVRVVCHNFFPAVFGLPSVPSVGDSVVGSDVVSDFGLRYSFFPVIPPLHRYDGLYGQLQLVVSLQVSLQSLQVSLQVPISSLR